MAFNRNITGRERGLRAAGGAGLLIVAFLVPMPEWAMWASIAGGAGLLISSVTGFCLACAMVGRRLPS